MALRDSKTQSAVAKRVGADKHNKTGVARARRLFEYLLELFPAQEPGAPGKARVASQPN